MWNCKSCKQNKAVAWIIKSNVSHPKCMIGYSQTSHPTHIVLPQNAKHIDLTTWRWLDYFVVHMYMYMKQEWVLMGSILLQEMCVDRFSNLCVPFFLFFSSLANNMSIILIVILKIFINKRSCYAVLLFVVSSNLWICKILILNLLTLTVTVTPVEYYWLIIPILTDDNFCWWHHCAYSQLHP